MNADAVLRDRFRLAVALSVLPLFAVVLYRAATMAMTWDEAYTVNVYAAHGGNIFSPKEFLPNNHVLHSLLVWLCFQAAPWQEWALRLPACLGALGCLAVLGRLGEHCFRETEPRNFRRAAIGCGFLVFLVSLHPLVFQFYGFARGYSLSLCFSLLGFCALLRLLDEKTKTSERPWMLLGGVAFGLSVAANLSSALMNTGLILAALLFEALRGRLTLTRVKRLLPFFCLPGLLIVGVFYGPILPFVSFGQFNYASETPWESLADLARWTLGFTDVLPESEIQHALLGLPIPSDLYWLLVVSLPFCLVLPIFLAALFRVLAESIRKEPDAADPARTALALVSFGLLFYGIILLVLWAFGRAAFPKDRTGLYPIVYFGILTVLLFDELRFRSRSRLGKNLGTLLGVGMALTLLHFLSLFAQPYNHNFWFADADVKAVMQTIRDRETKEGDTLACTWINLASMEFYAKKFGLEKLEIRCSRQQGDARRWAGEAERGGRMFLYFPPDLEEELRTDGIPFQRLRESPVLGFTLLMPCCDEELKR